MEEVLSHGVAIGCVVNTSYSMATLRVVKGNRIGYYGVRHSSRNSGTMTDTEWQGLVKGLLKAEMKRRGLTYEALSAKLAEQGTPAEAHVLRNKVSRGGFSAVFLVQCLRAMGCRELRLE
jgi:hypothetical protein